MRVIDLTDQRFGKLLVLRRGENKPNGKGTLAAWVCKCDCGRETLVRGRDLRTGNSATCGCSTDYELQIGKVFGKLTVVGIGEPTTIKKTALRQEHTSIRWKCLCECGGAKDVLPCQLFKRSVKSCGCIYHKPRSTKNEAAANNLFAQYKSAAKRANREFSISINEFKLITRMDCYFCGTAPSQVYKCRGYLGEYQPLPYVYNGIDRLDSGKGYASWNIVPCCGICNRMKMAHSVEFFYSHMGKILARRVAVE
jgi:hypothetical protein